MIEELGVEQIAVIERITLPLGPGFTVMTGETGAGKSLLVDAIALGLGDRADTELIRTGASKGTVVLTALIEPDSAAYDLCRELDIELEDGRLVVHREVSAGRSIARVNGRSCPVSVLRQLGAAMVDLHGQHDHQALLNPETHIDYTDMWIGEPAAALLAKVGAAHSKFEDACAALNALKRGLREREQRIDLLKFQVEEIQAVNPQVGEIAETEASLSRLKHSEALRMAAMTAWTLISEGETSALDKLNQAAAALDRCIDLDPTLEPILESLRAGIIAAYETSRALTDYSEEIESDPNALEDTAARLDALKRLCRKYGETEAAVIDHLVRSEKELAVLTDAEASEEELTVRLESARREFDAVCAELTALRQDRASKFAEQVQGELRELAMEQARFRANIEPREPDAKGADQLTFLFSANAGEEPKPLNKIASGGEVSRVMLALKVVLAGKAGVPTLIFDEIDSGLSGRAAAVVAKKLEQISRFYQVIAISHLPQLAGRATTHFRIEKVELDGRTFTQVRELTGEFRVAEVARMLAGEEVGESALANARELIQAGSVAARDAG